MPRLPKQYARRIEQSARRLKGRTIILWIVGIAVASVVTYTYYQVPGYFHAYFYKHETFRDCPDCPELVVVPAGSFMMGSEDGAPDERPARHVTIDYDLAVGIFEVTQANWYAIMGTRPSRYREDDLPVDRVSWYDAQAFVTALSVKTGQTYRLLSEVEWEYMARGGTTTQWVCGSDVNCVNLYGWHAGNSYTNNPVGQKIPNDFGIYDTHGNVWEWVEDCYQFGYDDAPIDGAVRPQAVGELCERAMRGGSTYTIPWKMRSPVRFRNLPERKFLNLGFRVAREM